MAKVTLTLLLISLMLHAATCQTFQYSRGWTNGKRGDATLSESQSTIPVEDFPIQEVDRHRTAILGLAWPSVSTCGGVKIRMLVRENGKPKIYLLPCEFLEAARAQKAKQRKEQEQNIQSVSSQNRRSAPILDDSYNDNY